jgi:hypothetical protein
MFADEVFRTTVVLEGRCGCDLPQRRIKNRESGRLSDSMAPSHHDKWIGDPSGSVVGSRVMQLTVSAPADAAEDVNLEWFFSKDPCGAQPAITAWCSIYGCLEHVWSSVGIKHNFRRIASCVIKSLRGIQGNLGLPGSGVIQSWRTRKRALGRNSEGRPRHDLGPRELTLSASSLCLMLAGQADNLRKERYQPGIGARSSKLLGAITTRIFHSWTLRIVAAPSQCILQIDHGSVDPRELGSSETGARLCRRTGVPKPSSIEHAKTQEAPRCARRQAKSAPSQGQVRAKSGPSRGQKV